MQLGPQPYKQKQSSAYLMKTTKHQQRQLTELAGRLIEQRALSKPALALELLTALTAPLSAEEEAIADVLREAVSQSKNESTERQKLIKKAQGLLDDDSESEVLGVVVWGLWPDGDTSYPADYSLGLALGNLADRAGFKRVTTEVEDRWGVVVVG